MHRWAVYATCWLFDCRGQTFMNKDVLGLLKATESWHLLAFLSFIKAAITVCVFCLTTCKIIPVWKKRKIKGSAERMWKYDDALWQVLRILGCPHFAKTTTFVLIWGLKKHQLHLHHLVYIAYTLPYAIYTVWLAWNIDVLCCILVKDIFYTGLFLDSTNLLSAFGEFCWVLFVIYLTQ